MKLDVGCGERKQGDINIDVNKLKRPDVVADAVHLPFKSETFTGLIAQALVEHLEDPTQGLKEFVRVLEPKGTFRILVPQPFLTNNAVFHLLRFFLNLPVSLLPPLLKHTWIGLRNLKTKPEMRHKRIITKDYMKRAQRLGFKVVEVKDVEPLLFIHYFPRKKVSKTFQLLSRLPNIKDACWFVCCKEGE